MTAEDDGVAVYGALIQVLTEVDEVRLRPLVPLTLLAIPVLMRLQRVLVNQLPRIIVHHIWLRHLVLLWQFRYLYVLRRILARHVQLGYF